jgi:hypothetical protein
MLSDFQPGPHRSLLMLGLASNLKFGYLPSPLGEIPIRHFGSREFVIIRHELRRRLSRWRGVRMYETTFRFNGKSTASSPPITTESHFIGVRHVAIQFRDFGPRIG